MKQVYQMTKSLISMNKQEHEYNPELKKDFGESPNYSKSNQKFNGICA